MPGLHRKVGKKVTTYFTVTAANKYIGLGNDLTAARGALSNMTGIAPAPIGTVAEMIDDEMKRRKARLAKKKLSPITYEDNDLSSTELKKRFGRMRPQDVRKIHIWEYLHKYRGTISPTRADREISLLSCAFAPLVVAEVLPSNPCDGVERNGYTPRERKVSREELDAFLAFARANGHITSTSKEAKWAKENLDAGRRIANALELSFLTTKAQGQVIKLTRGRVKSEGIEWPKPRKRGAPTLTEWTPALQACIDRCLAMPAVCNGQDISPTFVIYTREGQPYTSRGFRAVVGKIMKAYREQHPHQENFTFHDAGRAHGITKLREDGRSASEVSGHMEEKTVARVYDRRTFRKAKAVE
jgi:hypothetical protein